MGLGEAVRMRLLTQLALENGIPEKQANTFKKELLESEGFRRALEKIETILIQIVERLSVKDLNELETEIMQKYGEGSERSFEESASFILNIIGTVRFRGTEALTPQEKIALGYYAEHKEIGYGL